MTHQGGIAFGIFLLFVMTLTYAIASGGDFSIMPHAQNESWFIYNDVQPNAIFDGAVDVINTADEIQKIKIYAVDANIGKDGGFLPNNIDAPRYGVGSFVKLENTSIVVPPHSKNIVLFSIHIPSQVTEREYRGAIIATQETTNDGTGVHFIARVGVRIYITIASTIQLASSPTPSRRKLAIKHVTVSANLNDDQRDIKNVTTINQNTIVLSTVNIVKLYLHELIVIMSTHVIIATTFIFLLILFYILLWKL